MYNCEVNVPVLCEFFVRHEQFAKVFEQVKKARPSVLLLYQDGPREGNEEDEVNIQKCRQIAEDIDWECEVHRLYQTKNVGCDPSGYIAQTWALSIVDRCIILEDDCVPSQSFFPYCAELLERYKDDERIAMICGMNSLGNSKHNTSYFYSRSMMIWGWATWRRVAEKWDTDYSFLKDDKSLEQLRNEMGKSLYKHFISKCSFHYNSGKEHFESLLKSFIFTNNSLSIIPSKNMITNIGVASETTHGADNIKKYAKKIQTLFFADRYEIDFPLKHPEYVINDIEYKKRVEQLMAYHKPLVQFFRGVECFVRKLIYK